MEREKQRQKVQIDAVPRPPAAAPASTPLQRPPTLMLQRPAYQPRVIVVHQPVVHFVQQPFYSVQEPMAHPQMTAAASGSDTHGQLQEGARASRPKPIEVAAKSTGSFAEAVESPRFSQFPNRPSVEDAIQQYRATATAPASQAGPHPRPSATVPNSPPSAKKAGAATFSDLESQHRRSQIVSASTLVSLPEEHKDVHEITRDRSERSYRNWFRIAQVLRAIAMTTHTWITSWPALGDPRVLALNGKALIIAILTATALDVVIAVQYLGSVWSIVADHSLLLDILPMFANLTLRVYSYRLTELIENPDVLNTISNNGFTFDQWNNPKYSNFVQLVLWMASIGLTMMFHSALRLRFFAKQYQAWSVGWMIVLKALLLLLDMISGSLFLYTFLVSLGIGIFGTSPDIPLMLAINITAPLVSTLCNSLINIPLLYTFGRIEKGKLSSQVIRETLAKIFSPISLLLSVFALFHIVVIAYLLNRLKLITLDNQVATITASFTQWDPRQAVVWLIAVNYVLNYLVGFAVTMVYWMCRLVVILGRSCTSAARAGGH
ncbi:hypothetical protein HDU91_006321 [Kappamyces sp. JEL0680]|nr:hypothetical protein HDU91_006321 [Kappamyces sp. JEL0680]